MMNKSILGAAVATVALVAVVGVWAFSQTQLTAQQLCIVLSQRIQLADSQLGVKGSATYDYFKEHPRALSAAHAETLQTVLSLPCRAKPLPNHGPPPPR
jgi:hypothetical protein